MISEFNIGVVDDNCRADMFIHMEQALKTIPQSTYRWEPLPLVVMTSSAKVAWAYAPGMVPYVVSFFQAHRAPCTDKCRSLQAFTYFENYMFISASG